MWHYSKLFRVVLILVSSDLFEDAFLYRFLFTLITMSYFCYTSITMSKFFVNCPVQPLIKIYWAVLNFNLGFSVCCMQMWGPHTEGSNTAVSRKSCFGTKQPQTPFFKAPPRAITVWCKTNHLRLCMGSGRSLFLRQGKKHTFLYTHLLHCVQ